MAPAYAYEKLNQAVRILSSTDFKLGDRLDAAISEIFTLNADRDFPPDLRDDCNSLFSAIRNYRKEGSPLELQSSLAEQMFALFKEFIRKYDFIINPHNNYIGEK